MKTVWKHQYDLREGDLIRIGPNGQLFYRVNNPLNPHEEVCAVVVEQNDVSSPNRFPDAVLQTALDNLVKEGKIMLGADGKYSLVPKDIDVPKEGYVQ